MTNDLSRRDFLRKSAAVGVGAGMAASLPAIILPGAAGATSAHATTGTLHGYGAPPIIKGKDYDRVFKMWSQKTGWQINYRPFASDKFVALFAAAQASGEPIDFLLLNGQDVRRYVSAGSLLPVEKLNHSQFYASSYAPWQFGGHIWSIPLQTVSGFPMQVNAYWLNKINMPYPTTYAEMQTVAAALKKQGVYLLIHDGGAKYLWPVWFFTLFAQTTGNRALPVTFAQLTGKDSFNNAATVDALTWLQEFQKQGFFTPDTASLQTTNALASWENGRALSWLHYDVYGLFANGKTPKNVNLALELLPRVVSDKKVKSQWPGAAYPSAAVYAKSSNAAMVDNLINYLSSEPIGQILATDTFAAESPNPKVHGDPVADKLGYKKLFPNLVTYLDWFWPPEVTAAFQDGMQAIVNGSQTPKQVAASAQKALEAKVAQGWKFGS